jgi:DNA polymerase sigma
MADDLGFDMEIYGSFSTGLWLSNCDVDLLMIPRQNQASIQESGNFSGRPGRSDFSTKQLERFH